MMRQSVSILTGPFSSHGRELSWHIWESDCWRKVI